jgi:hypothetical protein
MKYDFVIVDSNNWYYRNYEIHKEKTHQVGLKTIVTGGIQGFLKSFEKWKRDFTHEDTIFYFLFDNATTKSNLRQQMIDPAYKENRKQRPKSFYRSIDYLRLILENYDNNLYCIYGTGYEADDIVPYVLKNIPKDSNKLLISEDLDWSRLISKNIHQYMKKEIFDDKRFLQKYGFKPTLDKIVLYKTIKGDSSDGIPIGVERFPTKKLIRLVDDYKDIYDVFDNLNIIDYLNETWKNKFKEKKNRLILNYQLVSFFKLDEKFVKECTSKGQYRPEQLKIIYKSLGFKLDEIDKRVYTYLKEKEAKKKGYNGFLKPPEVYLKRK